MYLSKIKFKAIDDVARWLQLFKWTAASRLPRRWGETKTHTIRTTRIFMVIISNDQHFATYVCFNIGQQVESISILKSLVVFGLNRQHPFVLLYKKKQETGGRQFYHFPFPSHTSSFEGSQPASQPGPTSKAIGLYAVRYVPTSLGVTRTGAIYL